MITTNIVMVLLSLLVLSFVVIFIMYNELKNRKEELKILEQEIEKLKENIYAITEIKQETIENQKKYRNNDDISNFNASIDFLRNLKNKGN